MLLKVVFFSEIALLITGVFALEDCSLYAEDAAVLFADESKSDNGPFSNLSYPAFLAERFTDSLT